MKFSMLSQVFTQMFKKPFTNKFPAKYAPNNTTNFLNEVGAGRAEIIDRRKLTTTVQPIILKL